MTPKNQSPDLLIPADASQRLQLADDVLILRRRSTEQAGLFLGDLSYTSVPEVLTLINSGRRSGDLLLQFDVARKTLSFIDGEVVAAQTNVEDDRLGEVMWRQGIISLDQLMIATSQLGAGKRLGRLLIDNGFIGTPELYQGLRAQVREVLLSVFHFRDGMYCFVGKTPELTTPFSLDQSTESLIMEGMRQLDELTRLRRAVGDFDAVVEATDTSSPSGKLREAEEAVLQLLISARKTLSIRSVLDKAHLGEYQGLKALHVLAQKGLAQIRRVEHNTGQKKKSSDPVVLACQVLNSLTTVLHDECDGADQWVAQYLEDLEIAGQPFFDAVMVGAKTLLDAQTLRAKAEAISAEAVDELVAALRDTIDFALFQISETLPPQRSGEVLAQVGPLLAHDTRNG